MQHNSVLLAQNSVRRSLWGSLFLLCFFAFVQAQHSPFESAIARFEAKLSADVANDSLGAITAGVFVGNKVVWKKGFGWADPANRIPADGETIYRIGSISKSMTAVLMVQMINKKYFSLDDPIERFLPEIKLLQLPPGSKPITFRLLATHTGGFAQEPDLPDAAAGPIETWEQKIIASIPTITFIAKPGEKYSYSNFGYGVLGLAVSRAAKRPFMDLMHEFVFTPLGMKNSAFILTPAMKVQMSVGYANEQASPIGPVKPAYEHAGRGYKVPPGGVYSTVEDLAKFAMSQMGLLPLPSFGPNELAEIQTRHARSNQNASYGLGFSISDAEPGMVIVGHGGSVAGYSANLVFEPAEKIGIVLLRNYNRGSTNLGQAARALLKELVTVRRQEQR
ncbi:MAG: beta-lactamase family protein [Ignavibacteriales bacterium]|nr:beta-lactamase family protein [Ignavibacteriales bacterium]